MIFCFHSHSRVNILSLVIIVVLFIIFCIAGMNIYSLLPDVGSGSELVLARERGREGLSSITAFGDV